MTSPLDTIHFTSQHSMMLTFVLIGAGIGSVVLGIVGFVWGARVPDERAGEVAITLGQIGLGLGLFAGSAVGAALFWALH
jgi:hypothetical protein